jgi:hypothetical protein
MVSMMIVMMEVVEMNGFFLKYVLWYSTTAIIALPYASACCAQSSLRACA